MGNGAGFDTDIREFTCVRERTSPAGGLCSIFQTPQNTHKFYKYS
jgi:hypothetical protein